MMSPTDNETYLASEKLRCEGKLCHIPGGDSGTVERVYQRRGMMVGVLGCRVLMMSGAVRYFDIVDVDCW